MFQASLCPSSEAQDLRYCIWYSALDVLAGVLVSREAGRVHTAWEPAHLVLNTICSNVGLVLLKMGIMMPETC